MGSTGSVVVIYPPSEEAHTFRRVGPMWPIAPAGAAAQLPALMVTTGTDRLRGSWCRFRQPVIHTGGGACGRGRPHRADSTKRRHTVTDSSIMFRTASTRARHPGGSTVVVSYCVMMAGPSMEVPGGSV